MWEDDKYSTSEKWEDNKYSESESCVCYQKLYKGESFAIFFNKETRTVDCSYMVFRRNQTPIEPGCERLSHSSKYGHWQKEWPVLGKEDIDFIYHKWHELFDQPKPVDAIKILEAMNIRKSEEK